jgi:hypothetical protein
MPQHESVVFAQVRERRERIADVLSAGPLSVKVIALRTKLPRSSVSLHLRRCAWFAKCGTNRNACWELTAIGRERQKEMAA